MSQKSNFPWGIPQYHVPLDTCTLYQNYYITGYSNTYRVPWFIGYEITSKVKRITMYLKKTLAHVA